MRLDEIVTGIGVLALLASAGCHGPMACPVFSSPPGLAVQVGDATSGAAICDATVTATETSTGKSHLLQAYDCEYRGVDAGTYDVLAQRAGFLARGASDVDVETRTSCGDLVDRLVVLELTPAP
jgi:hypothetical protein